MHCCTGLLNRMAGFFLTLWLVAGGAGAAADSYLGPYMPYEAFDRLARERVEVSGGVIWVAFAPGDFGLPREALLGWVRRAASAVTAYYGRFPARTTRLLIVPRPGRGVSGGKTWSYAGAAIRVSVGAASDEADLARDWVLVHEMTHLAFPLVADRHHWIEEGIAVYVEGIARSQAAQLDAEEVWGDLSGGLPQGLPQPGDRGLDNTPTWGRTYWGGALFCLLADLEIRRRTGNHYGLQDALRAILARGNMETTGDLDEVLARGDDATGVPVLRELYSRMRDQPHPVDLDVLWRKLGIVPAGRRAHLHDDAPEAALRRAITRARAG